MIATLGTCACPYAQHKLLIQQLVFPNMGVLLAHFAKGQTVGLDSVRVLERLIGRPRDDWRV